MYYVYIPIFDKALLFIKMVQYVNIIKYIQYE